MAYKPWSIRDSFLEDRGQSPKLKANGLEPDSTAHYDELKPTSWFVSPDSGSDHLCHILATASRSVVSNPLDHVYCLLGMAHEQHRKHIGVDYGLGPRTLFLKTSLFLWHNSSPGIRPRSKRIHSAIDNLCCEWRRYATPTWACDFSREMFRSYKDRWERSESALLENSAIMPADVEPFKSLFWNKHRVSTPESWTLSLAPSPLPHDRPNVQGFRLATVCTSLCGADYIPRPDEWSDAARVLDCSESRLRSMDPNAEMSSSRVRDLMSMCSYDLFRTDNGHVGFCDHDLNPLLDYKSGCVSVINGDLVVHFLCSTLTVLLRETTDGGHISYNLIGPCMLSNDACGCREGKMHELNEVEIFTLC